MNSPKHLPGLLAIADQLFHGSAAEFARAIGISRATMSRILSEKSPPSRKIMGLVARLPRVNPAWARTGEGEPLLPDETDAPLSDSNVLLTERLLSGPPRNRAFYSSIETMVKLPVAHQDLYAVRWKNCDHDSQCVIPGMANNDLLFVDTDLKKYFRDIRWLSKRIVVWQDRPDAALRLLNWEQIQKQETENKVHHINKRVLMFPTDDPPTAEDEKVEPPMVEAKPQQRKSRQKEDSNPDPREWSDDELKKIKGVVIFMMREMWAPIDES